MKTFYKTILLLIINCQLSIVNSFSQSPLAKQWDKRFGGSEGELVFSLQQTADGGFILGGFSYSGLNGDKTQPNWDPTGNTPDYWIVKVNSLGNKQWDKTFGGTNAESFTSLQQTADGGYILGGYSSSGISGDKTQNAWGFYDYWIVKIDSLGNKLWDKDYGGIYNDLLVSVQLTPDGGYILGGYSGSGISGDKTQPNWGGDDFWIIKIDSLGNMQWDKDFGGTAVEYFSSLQQTADGGYILGGYSTSGISGDKTQANWDTICSPLCSYDYWIVKIDSLGNKQWDKTFGGLADDWLYTVRQTADKGYILGGSSKSGISGNKTEPTWGVFDYWIVKTDSLGNKQWEKDFGGTSEEEFCSMLLTDDGGYLLSGGSYSPASGNKTENNLGLEQTWIIKADSSGSIQWEKTIFTTGQDVKGFVTIMQNECYAIANSTDAGIGGFKTEPTQGGDDYWIIKFCDSTLISSTKYQVPSTQYEISPNPSTGIFQITFPISNRKTNYTLEIINTLGQTVFVKQLQTLNSKLQTNIDVSFLPKGIYVLKINDGTSNFSKRIILQ